MNGCMGFVIPRNSVEARRVPPVAIRCRTAERIQAAQSSGSDRTRGTFLFLDWGKRMLERAKSPAPLRWGKPTANRSRNFTATLRALGKRWAKSRRESGSNSGNPVRNHAPPFVISAGTVGAISTVRCSYRNVAIPTSMVTNAASNLMIGCHSLTNSRKSNFLSSIH